MKKGFTYEEALGEKKAKEIKDNLKKIKIISKEKIIKEFKKAWKKFGPMTKVESRKYFICNEETIRYKFNGLDNFAKECNIKFKKADMAHTKGMTWEEIHGKEKAQKLRQKRKDMTTGKSWIERFGLEKAQQMKKSVAEKQSKKYKGKSYEERFGLEKALEMREEQSKKRKGNKNALKHKREDIISELQIKFKQYGAFKKSDFSKFMSCHGGTAKNRFGSLDKLAEEAGIQFKQVDNKIFNHGGRLGKNENRILDEYEKIRGYKIEKSVTAFSHNKTYYIDGFDPVLNSPIEVDESFHNNQKVQDEIREKNILKLNKWNQFIRLDEQEWLNKINNSQKSLNNFVGEIK